MAFDLDSITEKDEKSGYFQCRTLNNFSEFRNQLNKKNIKMFYDKLISDYLSCKWQNYFHEKNDDLSMYQNRIVYLIPQKNGTSVGKIARNQNEEKTVGGATGNLSELSDFYIDHQNLRLPENNPNFTFVNKNSSDNICKNLELKTDGNKVKGVKFPNHVVTATPCEFEIYNSEGNLDGEFTILLNHTYRYWCQADDSLSARKTAQLIGLCNNNDQEIKYTFELLLNNKNISDISALTGFYSVHTLELNKNKISYLPPHFFDDMILLNHLDLSNNEFNTLFSSVFNNLVGLRVLYLNGNNLKKVPYNLIYNIKLLHDFSITFGSTSKIPEEFFKNTQDISILSLFVEDYNKIPENLFDYFEKLSLVELFSGVKNQEIPLLIVNKLSNYKKLEKHENVFFSQEY
jgi:Leucine-rich repeat (LRR) protein